MSKKMLCLLVGLVSVSAFAKDQRASFDAQAFYQKHACPLVDESVSLSIQEKDGQVDFGMSFKDADDWKKLTAKNSDGTINALIEIPAGCLDKWEWHGDSMVWDKKKGQLRMIKYLAYPGNYGMIPKSKGGDGDPLDIIVLGPAIARGRVVPVKLVGVLEMLDDGEVDDKLIAVPAGLDIEEYEAKAISKNGITDILRLWFQGYKGNDDVKITGIGSAKKAKKILKKSL